MRPVDLAAGEIAPIRYRPGQQLVRSGPENRIVPLMADFLTSNRNVSFHVPTDYPEAFAASGIKVMDDNHGPVLAFMISADGILYHSTRESGACSAGTLADGWSDWSSLGTDDDSITDWYNYTPTAIISGQVRDDDQFERLFDVMAVRQSDNSLWRRTSTDGKQWSLKYVNMGGFCTSRAVGINLNRYDNSTYSLLTARGGDGRLWYSLWNGTATLREWSAFEPVPEVQSS